jgi:hypothetical protein
MPNTSRKPPLFVAWLSLSRRMKLAAGLRGCGSSLAEWICPEIAEADVTDEKGADE